MNVRIHWWTKDQVDAYSDRWGVTQARAADDLIRTGLLGMRLAEGKITLEHFTRSLAYLMEGMGTDGLPQDDDTEDTADEPCGTAPLFREPGATS